MQKLQWNVIQEQSLQKKCNNIEKQESIDLALVYNLQITKNCEF